MEEFKRVLSEHFNTYCHSFKNLSSDQQRSFSIKRDHSFRVAELSGKIAASLELDDEKTKTAYFMGLFHDVGRFKQLIKYNTFNDSKSFDHANYSAQIIQEIFADFRLLKKNKETVLTAIKNHNKFKLPNGLGAGELQFSKLLRDADKLDILKVLTEYYRNRNIAANHTLTWELPKGLNVSKSVQNEVLTGKPVSKSNVVSEIDIKIMQLSWVYDLNFRYSAGYVLQNEFLEKIYKALPPNQLIESIYNKVKTFTENMILCE